MSPPIARERLYRAEREAGVPRATPQGLRTGFITLALAAGIPEREVAISAGHASSAQTARYDALRVAVERHAGLALAAWVLGDSERAAA